MKSSGLTFRLKHSILRVFLKGSGTATQRNFYIYLLIRLCLRLSWRVRQPFELQEGPTRSREETSSNFLISPAVTTSQPSLTTKRTNKPT